MAPGRDGVKERSAREADQRRRRVDLLARQKERRAQHAAATRGILTEPASGSDTASVAADDAEMQGFEQKQGFAEEAVLAAVAGSQVKMPDAMQTDALRPGCGGRKQAAEHCYELSTKLMSAEWMVDMPDDLSSSWYVLARPAGQRCLVAAGGGSTTARTRRGRTWRFPSALPGGSRAGKSAGRCELDCVWSEAQQTYFVLDVLSWKEHRLLDYPAEFRFFWLRSKLTEGNAHTQTSRNPCRFVAPPIAECTSATLQHAYTAPTEYERDGLLFYHREALYESGPSPLVLLWSDPTCSARFFDYGSEQMATALEQEPAKAQRWRTEEVSSAHSFSDLLERIEGAMDTRAHPLSVQLERDEAAMNINGVEAASSPAEGGPVETHAPCAMDNDAS